MQNQVFSDSLCQIYYVPFMKINWHNNESSWQSRRMEINIGSKFNHFCTLTAEEASYCPANIRTYKWIITPNHQDLIVSRIESSQYSLDNNMSPLYSKRKLWCPTHEYQPQAMLCSLAPMLAFAQVQLTKLENGHQKRPSMSHQ